MSPISDKEIRHQILNVLYKLAKKKPLGMLGRKPMQELLKIPEEQMDFNIFYLREKGLVKLLQGLGAPWFTAEITAFGIDVIENRDKYTESFPFIQTTIQEIHGDIYGTVVQAVESKVDIKQQVTSAFQKAHEITDKMNIESSLKEEIQKQLKLLEEELKKEEVDAGKVQRFWKWLKENASWLVPTLGDVVIESVNLAMRR